MYSRKLYEYYAKIDGKMRVIEIFSQSETENCEKRLNLPLNLPNTSISRQKIVKTPAKCQKTVKFPVKIG